MRTGIFATILFFFTLSGFAQNLSSVISGRYDRPVKKEELMNANYISDFIVGYPTSWIDKYDSVVIVITSGGKVIKPRSSNESLTTEQKNILKATQPGDAIYINIDYQIRNTVTGLFEKRKINISVTVIPDVEAQYLAGSESLKAYLKKQVADKIPASKVNDFKPVEVFFTVDKSGAIGDVKISKSCGDPFIDKAAVEAITRLSKFKPAECPKGTKVKQEFKFSVGTDGC
jgi:TonB family protein